MKDYIVTYNAKYYVTADSEQEALEQAQQEHDVFDDCTWEVNLDPYSSNNQNTLGEK
jgi:hypothetical protein